MINRIQIEITPVWSLIPEVKEKIRNIMSGMNSNKIDFTMIVVSELLENAIKYGEMNTRIANISIIFELDQQMVLMSIKNGIGEYQNLDSFLNTMSKIKTTVNKKSLYLERLQEIMRDPSLPGSKLGLYRIVSESEFDLDFHIDEYGLEMLATKKFWEI
jgi:hypothetical protein